MQRRKKLFPIALLFLLALAISDQLTRPADERDWHGRILGTVPYDFRRLTMARVRACWWNPDDERIVTPIDWGFGWGINLAQVRRLVLPAAD